MAISVELNTQKAQLLREEVAKHGVKVSDYARHLIEMQLRAPIKNGLCSAWEVLEGLAGTIDAPPDWAIEHDQYLSSAPKMGRE